MPGGGGGGGGGVGGGRVGGGVAEVVAVVATGGVARACSRAVAEVVPHFCPSAPPVLAWRMQTQPAGWLPGWRAYLCKRWRTGSQAHRHNRLSGVMCL